MLAIVPAGLAAIRSMPAPWNETWTNRRLAVDIGTCVLFSLLLIVIAFIVPLTQ